MGLNAEQMRRAVNANREKYAYARSAVFSALGGNNPLVKQGVRDEERKDINKEGDKKQATAGIMAKAPAVVDDVPSQLKEELGGDVQKFLERVYRFESELINKDAPTKKYTVEAGETLTDIMEKTGSTLSELMFLNEDIKDKDRLYGGDVINVPSTKVADLGLAPDILTQLGDLVQNIGGTGVGTFVKDVYTTTPPYVSQAVKAQMQRLKGK